MAEYDYKVFEGNYDTMLKIAERKVVTALDPKANRRKEVVKGAKLWAVETVRFTNEDGQEIILGELRSNFDLVRVAQKKGMIL